MAIAADARRVLDLLNARPPIEASTPEAARAASRERAAATAVEIQVALVDELAADGPAGPIRLRRYDPSPGKTTALVVFFHGGGWVMCDLDTHDTVCRSLAAGSGATVVSVDYRLAPEHPFPAGLEDCYAATTWAVEQAGELGVDARRVAVAGDSAGGNLAAAVTLLARDRRRPALAHQLLVYPVLDPNLATASYLDYGEGFNLTSTAMRWFWEHYLAGAPGDDPLASPLRAPDLAGLPPALVVTAEHDPLRDEGEAYVERLRAAGTDAKLIRAPGLFHGFFSCFGLIDGVDALRSCIESHLRSALHPSTGR